MSNTIGGLGAAADTGGALSGLDSIFDTTSKFENAVKDKISKFDPSSETATADMLQLQMEMGKYNSMVEMTSQITKTMADSLKSVASKL